MGFVNSALERWRRRPSGPVYEALDDGSDGNVTVSLRKRQRFSWLDYSIFLLMGVSMLWAWNMFLAASPYFQHRFARSPKLLKAYSPTLLSVSTSTNLVAMIILTYMQSAANYPFRIILSLLIDLVAFALLALSTVMFREVSGLIYFVFLMLMVFLASLAAGLCQNGLFAYVSGFASAEYAQSIMTGQAVAGVLPCIAQIVSVLAVPVDEQRLPKLLQREDGSRLPAPRESGSSAFVYFLTAVVICIASIVAFIYLLRRHPSTKSSVPILQKSGSAASYADDESQSNDDPLSSALNTAPVAPPITASSTPERNRVPFSILFVSTQELSIAVCITFALAMFFPVYTQRIQTVHEPPIPRLLQPSIFIPLAFLAWSCGDLIGRLLPLIPPFSVLRGRNRTILLVACLRVCWPLLYSLCNGSPSSHAAPIQSDAFYLGFVQFGFGLGNGYLGSLCMMGAGDSAPRVIEHVRAREGVEGVEAVGGEEGAREAIGSFMGLMLVFGLSVGSISSFLVATD